jgi:hypothetical protein
VHTVQGDISQAETAQRIIEETLDRFGRIDTLINNAGIFIGKPFLEYTDDFAAMTAVNPGGFFHLTQRVVRDMAEQCRGHVVNITTSLVDHARVASPSALASLTKGGTPRPSPARSSTSTAGRAPDAEPSGIGRGNQPPGDRVELRRARGRATRRRTCDRAAPRARPETSPSPRGPQEPTPVFQPPRRCRTPQSRRTNRGREGRVRCRS